MKNNKNILNTLILISAFVIAVGCIIILLFGSILIAEGRFSDGLVLVLIGIIAPIALVLLYKFIIYMEN